MKTGIYSITNVLNNKRYIGYSCNIERRFRKHKNDLRRSKHHSIHLQNSWNEYGESYFIFEVIEECDKEDLCSREDYWVRYFSSLSNDKGYNIRPTDPNIKTGLIAEETRLKIIIAATGRPSPLKGVSMTKETKEKLSLSLKGRTAPNKGRKWSDQQREKIKQTKLKTKMLRNVTNIE